MDDLAHGDAFELWGAFEGAKTAGVIIERFQSLAFEGKPIEAGEVYVVGVLPEFRGRGVATAPSSMPFATSKGVVLPWSRSFPSRKPSTAPSDSNGSPETLSRRYR